MSEGKGRPVQGLGPIAAVALVVGNIIGAGIYVVPGALAEIAGPLAFVAWLINVAAYFCLAAVFADMGGAYSARTGTPVAALVVSSVLPAMLLLLYFNGTLLEASNFMALASTAMALVVLGTTCAAEIVLLRREPGRFTASQRRRGPLWALAALAFVALMLAGVGASAALLTLFAAVGLAPCYFWIRQRSAAAMSRDTIADADSRRRV